MENNNLNHSSSMAKPMDAWKYIREAGGCFTPEQIAANPYLTPKKTPDTPPPEDLPPDTSALDPVPSPGVVSGSSIDWLTLAGIVCRGADNKPFEQHDTIFVAKDVIRKTDGSHERFTPYQGITYFEQQGNNEFLPSFALTCNILAALYAEMQKGDTEAQAILDQYKDYGAGHGWHAQNTIVQWNGRNSKVLHYPYDDQFPKNGGSDNVNNQQGLHKELSFNSKDFGDVPLEEALKKKEFVDYIKNLTGLPNPNILVDIGKYFGKPAKIWVPNDQDAVNDTRAAWLGCDNNFFIISFNSLGDSSAARGVRRAP